MKSVELMVPLKLVEVISSPVAVRSELASDDSSNGLVNKASGPAISPVHNALAVFSAMEQSNSTPRLPSVSDAAQVVEPYVIVCGPVPHTLVSMLDPVHSIATTVVEASCVGLRVSLAQQFPDHTASDKLGGYILLTRSNLQVEIDPRISS